MITKITEAFTKFIAAIKRNGILISLYAVALLYMNRRKKNILKV